MESKTSRRFRELLDALPAAIQRHAHGAYALFRDNPDHPSLRFEKVHSTLPIYSARVTLGYRAVGVIEENVIIWFWIGTHSDYERLLGGL